jgi:hypothetical protein
MVAVFQEDFKPDLHLNKNLKSEILKAIFSMGTFVFYRLELCVLRQHTVDYLEFVFIVRGD